MNQDQTQRQIVKETRAFPIYPLLIGIYPVLALIAFNVTQIDLLLTVRSLILSFVFAAVVFGILRLILRDWSRAAFLTMIFLILFYSYGHIYTLVRNGNPPDFIFARHRFLIAVWIGLFVLAWIFTRKSIHWTYPTSGLNIISILLLVYPLFQIVSFEVNTELNRSAASVSTAPGLSGSANQPRPDIYFIVLDAYMRSDNIKAIYGYDNSGFLNALTQKGFYVAACGQSNYAYTEPSLASTLNIEYLDKLSVTNDTQANYRIQTSTVRSFLEARGYKTVAFETGWGWSQWKDADVYYPFRSNSYINNPFESLFIQTTALRGPVDMLQVNVDLAPHYIEHDRIIYNLNILKSVPLTVKGPKFVFAHLIIPHPPHVFGPNGEFAKPSLSKQGTLTGYENALTFIDKAMLDVVNQIIANSKIPPVIVIEGDHGSFIYNTPAQRMSDLNAYYLPGKKVPLYPTITPVNTFRLIFNAYFGQNYPLLPDTSWFTLPGGSTYTFQKIPSTCHP